VTTPAWNRYITIHGHFYQPPRENPWLDMVEVQDSAYPFHDWNVYNIGSGGTMTLLHLVAELNELLGTNMKPKHGSARSGDVRHSQADITRAKKWLGYHPMGSFSEALCITLQAFQAQPGCFKKPGC
jgi:nucleoside-diphosphate-sugar epimerase